MASNQDVNLTVDDIKILSGTNQIEVIHSKNKRVMLHTILDRIDSRYRRFMSRIYPYVGRDIDKYLIHYQTGSDGIHRLGHWCALLIDNIRKEALFFDPLGIFPDNQTNLINELVKEQTDQLERHIGNFLFDLSKRGYKIYYNEIPFQRIGSNTCGRYCALIFLLSKYKLIQPKEFKNILNIYRHMGDYDDIVINITSKL